ncbi:hypothetical protein HF086_012184 [Spodoptera exigua]|uniref:NADP-dependent oxidoreductase domain-containing protein n=1 Tax=Spodoptera exigua TaxID=7107 RepID=A0A922SAU8_SPOEX|nr:hypothetical protein HF086_012184 [Spodoptera exigua]
MMLQPSESTRLSETTSNLSPHALLVIDQTQSDDLYHVTMYARKLGRGRDQCGFDVVPDNMRVLGLIFLGLNTDTLDDVRNAVFWAIEAGYRHIDTAAVYGDEEQVGQGIADAIAKGIVTRDQLFITTKLWNDKHARDQVVPALKESLSRLGLEYVDLYLIHFPISTKADGSPDNIDYLDTWKGMEEAKQLGLTTSIGVSNFNISQIDRLLSNSNVPPAVNEFEVNPTLTQEPLVHHCMSHNIAVMAYSPFGFLVSRSRPDAPPPRYDDPTIGAIAAKYGKSPGQVVLRFALKAPLRCGKRQSRPIVSKMKSIVNTVAFFALFHAPTKTLNDGNQIPTLALGTYGFVSRQHMHT